MGIRAARQVPPNKGCTRMFAARAGNEMAFPEPLFCFLIIINKNLYINNTKDFPRLL
jgi:hypothetical protein